MREEYVLSLEDYTFLVEYANRLDKFDRLDNIFPSENMSGVKLAWIELGKKYKFNPWTVEKLPNSYYKFTAESVA